MVKLSPVIRLDSKETFGVLKAFPLDLIVVRFQDLISKTTYEFNETFNQIAASGGLHKFLSFNGQILLSMIMRDRLIANVKPINYATAINSLHPDSFTTTDGETYDREFLVAPQELLRIQKYNEELLSLVKGIKPFGLVKGCSETQVTNQVRLLKSYGIDDFIFHIADFFRERDPDMIRRGRTLSLVIRKQTDKLTLYGPGSQRRLQEYSFADRLVTYTHFVAALKGWKFLGTKQTKYTGGYNEQIVTHNFLQLYKKCRKFKVTKDIICK